MPPSRSLLLLHLFSRKSELLSWLSWLVSCLGCGGVFLAAQSNSAIPAVEKAEDLFRKSVVAYGGENKVLSLQDGCYEYTVGTAGKPESKPISMRACFESDSLFRSEARGENLEAVTVLNGNRGWVRVGDSTLSLSKKEIDPVRISMVVQLRPDLLLLSFPKRRYSGQAQDEGRTLDLVEVSGYLGGEYVRGRLSFDASSSLIAKYEYEIERESAGGKGVVKGEERYLKYGEKEGLKIPLEVLSRQSAKSSRLVIKNVIFNTNLDPALFQEPSSPDSQPFDPKP